ncbi:MAG: hypothetical protein AAB895_01650 [Patescibacteria group bacterium]
MQINDEKKVDVLLLALKERYESIHKIRERVQSIGIWALGLLFASGGWVFQSEKNLECIEKSILIGGIIFAFLMFKFNYLKNLQDGFKSQQRAAVKIETALGLYQKDFFSQTGTSIYDSDWKDSGQSNSKGKFFRTTTWLLLIGIVFFIAVVVAKDTSGASKEHPAKHFHKYTCFDYKR